MKLMGLKKIIQLNIFVVVMLPFSVLAAPAITSVSGTISHGQSITISGSGFGTKSTAAPNLWDTVSNQYTGLSNGSTIPSGSGYVWGSNGRNDEPGIVKYNTTGGEQRGRDTANYKAINTVNGTLQAHTITPAPSSMYASWWLKLNGDANNGGNNDNNKYVRLMLGEGANGMYSWNSNNDNVWNGSMYCDAVNWISTAPVANSWNFLEVWVNSSTQTYESRINGVSNGLINWGQCGAFNFDSIGQIGFDAQGGARTVWFGDIYFDRSLSRVMIGNASTYAASTHFEMQIPTAWSSNGTSINASVNQGSFADGSIAYLYVIDASGNVSAGQKITIGSGSGSSDPTAVKNLNGTVTAK
jgi:hypothetical protein